MNHLYIFGTILFTVYGQLILKWRIGKYGALPEDLGDRISFLLHLFLDGYIVSAFVAAFVASLLWMSAMTKFDISYAYPSTSLTLVLGLTLRYGRDPRLWLTHTTKLRIDHVS